MNHYQELEELRIQYPDLTFYNEGYENIPDEVREANAEGQAKIEAVLKEAVANFVRFQNFKPRKDGSYAIRCQTMWDPGFQGVTYIPMEAFRGQIHLEFRGTDLIINAKDLHPEMLEHLKSMALPGQQIGNVTIFQSLYQVTGDPEDCRNFLRPFGAWEEDELQDHEENLNRLVWLTGCALAEENEAYFAGY